MLNIKWTIFATQGNWVKPRPSDLSQYSASKHSALISKFRGPLDVFLVPCSFLCCPCLFSYSVCHTWCFITIRRCFRRSMVSMFGVTNKDYVFGASDLFPVDSIKVCEFTLFMVIFFTRGFTLSQKYPPPQLCVRQVGRVWHIKILIHLRSTRISADIFWVWTRCCKRVAAVVTSHPGCIPTLLYTRMCILGPG